MALCSALVVVGAATSAAVAVTGAATSAGDEDSCRDAVGGEAIDELSDKFADEFLEPCGELAGSPSSNCTITAIATMLHTPIANSGQRLG